MYTIDILVAPRPGWPAGLYYFRDRYPNGDLREDEPENILTVPGD